MGTLLEWLASLPPDARDAAVEERLGIAEAPLSASRAPLAPHLIGYHASAIAPIVRMLIEVPVVADDVLVDIGAGLGKVVILAHLLAGATARGIELQPELAARARQAATRTGADVTFTEADARDAELGDGTVFFLYLPFTGEVLTEVLRRLEVVARGRAIAICALGVDLDRHAPWLVRRPVDSFWLAIYDSVVPGVPPRPARASALPARAAEVVAFERAW